MFFRSFFSKTNFVLLIFFFTTLWYHNLPFDTICILTKYFHADFTTEIFRFKYEHS